MTIESLQDEVHSHKSRDFLAISLAASKSNKFKHSEIAWSNTIREFMQGIENEPLELQRILKPISDDISNGREGEPLRQVEEFLHVMRVSGMMPYYGGEEDYYSMQQYAKKGILNLYGEDFDYATGAINRLASLIDKQLAALKL